MNVRTFVVVVGLAVGMGVSSVSANNILANRRMVLTFSGAVALPGRDLPAGSYTFQLADPNASHEVVEVMNRDRTRVLYLGLTNRVNRPSNLPAGRSVVFGEARRGEPAPITAWYPEGDSGGYEFIYR